MLGVIRTTWPLLLGVMLLMVGNGMQGTLLGVRGGIEAFSTYQMSVVMAGYSVGMLAGAKLVPLMIRNVGHVRVFSALGSLISAVLLGYAAFPEWLAWSVMRVVMGFGFAGVYIAAESWLNNASTNETRGQALSAYMIVQMIGIIAAQGIMTVGDVGGYQLFVIASILVSLAFTPILLAAGPAPVFSQTRPLTMRRLFRASPLGCVGMFLMGGVFAAIFAMVSVWGMAQGLTVKQLSLFVAAIYSGGLIAQYPLGWLSDRMDRRVMIAALAGVGALAALLGMLPLPYPALLAVGAVAGGVANPLYALLIAYTNDYLDGAEMAGASGGLLFINGLGAIGGPMAIATVMNHVGPRGFFLFLALCFAGISAYAVWRMSRRAVRARSGHVSVISPVAQGMAVEAVLGSHEDHPGSDTE